VAEDHPGAPEPYGLDTIRQLAELMTLHDLSEIDLEQSEGRVRLRRGPRGVVSAMPMAGASSMQAAAPAAPTESSRSEKNVLLIKSEAIGTFYSRPKPDVDPYVKAGSKVTPTTVVGLIEAMKLFNEVQAGCDGVIVEICVDNQQAVEYGTVLFKVDPAG
jgi:acetyl-CoA carboxylase biotin carboxyl carrier protein